MWKDGNYYCPETGEVFLKGEVFYYYYWPENTFLSGTIGKLDYKQDGHYKWRKTLDMAKVDKSFFIANKIASENPKGGISEWSSEIGKYYKD